MHQYYSKSYYADNWIRRLLKRAGLDGAPKGTTIGPVQVLTPPAGPNRKMRRHTKSIWRRFGAAAEKIANRRDIPIDAALKIAMESRK